MLSDELEYCLNNAFQNARENLHELITIEHLLLALLNVPDILEILSQPGNGRPRLVVGFAAETGDVVEKAIAKRVRKGCDWIIGNDVSPKSGTFGGDTNQVHLVTETESESWPKMSKQEVADALARRIADQFQAQATTE